MIGAVLAFINMIPGINTMITGITTAFFNSKVQMYQARWGVARDVAVAAIQAEAQSNEAKVNWILALAKNPVMQFIVFGFAMPYIIYEWKAIVYDKVWMAGHASTDPITGPLLDWSNIILTGIFVTSMGIGVSHAIVNKQTS